MLAPMIHLNGSPQERLLDAAISAGEAVLQAIVAVTGVAPNGRDYYPLGDAAHGEALTAYRGMLAKLESVKAELDALAAAIADG
jgi:hypothetical protein